MLVFQALLVSKRKQNRINFAILHWKWVPLLSSKHNHGIYGTYLIHWKNILCWTYALFLKLFCLLLFGFGWGYFLLQPEGTISIISVYKLDTYIFSSNFNESQVCVRNLRVSFFAAPSHIKRKVSIDFITAGSGWSKILGNNTLRRKVASARCYGIVLLSQVTIKFI